MSDLNGYFSIDLGTVGTLLVCGLQAKNANKPNKFRWMRYFRISDIGV